MTGGVRDNLGHWVPWLHESISLSSPVCHSWGCFLAEPHSVSTGASQYSKVWREMNESTAVRFPVMNVILLAVRNEASFVSPLPRSKRTADVSRCRWISQWPQTSPRVVSLENDERSAITSGDDLNTKNQGIDTPARHGDCSWSNVVASKNFHFEECR